ncbi:MAG: aminoglycoside phosphotransferase family protein [Deltaproteobacteria bacterium]|nr:aminoglycoside phosphotransferase family protein [Deltaproteobacteria bacterium]
MPTIERKQLERYLSTHYDASVEVLDITPLGDAKPGPGALKGYGYGTPLRIDFTVNGQEVSVVLSTVNPGGFGHQRMSDRAALLLWQYRGFNSLPRHVRALDVGGFTRGGPTSLAPVEELFLVTEFVEGTVYAEDLNRIRREGRLEELDLERAAALARYLAEIHAEKQDDPGMYERRTRELVGHNECLMGLTDSYPQDHPDVTPEMLIDIEKRCIDWRWRLKRFTHRLSRVHGDFHPFNLLFRDGTDFSVLDRSRGSYGEPADDLAGLSVNYLFWGLLHKKTFVPPFRTLWDAFFQIYLEAAGDDELLSTLPPYLTWRLLVLASPVWYPDYDSDVRRALLRLARNVLDAGVFDPYNVDRLLEEAR